MDGTDFPFETVIAAVVAALRDDSEGARLLVDLLPASQLRDSVFVLARMLAGAFTSVPGSTGEVPAAWLSLLLANLADEGGA